MCSSAMRSSSRIATPGSRCSAMSASVSARSAPARAIPSISASDLRTITLLRLDLAVSLRLRERVLDLAEDLGDGAVCVQADDVRLARAEVLDKRRGLPVVELEAPLDPLRCVVGAPLLRRAAEQPLQEHRPVRDLEVEDDVELAAELAQEPVERLRLGHRAREAVEDEAADRVAAREPVADQADHQVVRGEVAAVVDHLQLPAEIGGQLLHLADHVARR